MKMKQGQGPQPTAIVPKPTGYALQSSARWPITTGKEDDSTTTFLNGSWYKMALFALEEEGLASTGVSYKIATNTRTLDANVAFGIWDYVTGELIHRVVDTLPAGTVVSRHVNLGAVVKLPRFFWLGISVESFEPGTVIEHGNCQSAGSFLGLIGGQGTPACDCNALFFATTHENPGPIRTATTWIFPSTTNISCRIYVQA